MASDVDRDHMVILMLSEPADRQAGLWLEVSCEMIDDRQPVGCNRSKYLLLRQRQIGDMAMRSKTKQ